MQVAPGRCGICRSSLPTMTPLDKLDCIYSRADNTILVRPCLLTSPFNHATCIHVSCMLAANHQWSDIWHIRSGASGNHTRHMQAAIDIPSSELCSAHVHLSLGICYCQLALITNVASRARCRT